MTLSAQVKEHNQSLVDDSIVLSDKIGSSVFFWSFPAQTYVERSSKLKNLQLLRSSKIAEAAEFENKIATLKQVRCSPDRLNQAIFIIIAYN